MIQNIKTGLRIAIIGAVAATAASAGAVDVRFDLTGPVTASFVLRQDPVPSVEYAGYYDYAQAWGQQWSMWGAGATVNGVYYDQVDISFFSASLGGGMDAGITNADHSVHEQLLFSTGGAQLYEDRWEPGKWDWPFFQPGVYNLTGWSDGLDYQLTISTVPLATGVPEPATWAMLVGGFFAVGSAMRRRSSCRSLDARTA